MTDPILCCHSERENVSQCYKSPGRHAESFGSERSGTFRLTRIVIYAIQPVQKLQKKIPPLKVFGLRFPLFS
jgi:hypothetical protein